MTLQEIMASTPVDQRNTVTEDGRTVWAPALVNAMNARQAELEREITRLGLELRAINAVLQMDRPIV